MTSRMIILLTAIFALQAINANAVETQKANVCQWISVLVQTDNLDLVEKCFRDLHYANLIESKKSFVRITMYYCPDPAKPGTCFLDVVDEPNPQWIADKFHERMANLMDQAKALAVKP